MIRASGAEGAGVPRNPESFQALGLSFMIWGLGRRKISSMSSMLAMLI